MRWYNRMRFKQIPVQKLASAVVMRKMTWFSENQNQDFNK